MKRPQRKRVPPNHGVSWDDLTRHLALHINWLHRTAPKTTASGAKIDRWRQQLDSSPVAASGKPGYRGDMR